MRIENDGRLIFRDDSRVAGVYVFGDPFKCFLHELTTPQGHIVSCTSPSDHVHHKGLMYALKAHDLNWWEEVESEQNGRIGRQRHVTFDSVAAANDEVGFTQLLEWTDRDGQEISVVERRHVSCRRTANAFAWQWDVELVARRDLIFVQSPWSYTHEGKRTNYHGLGLRLRRDIGAAGRRRLLIDGQPMPDVSSGMGARARDARLEAQIDPVYPCWPPPCVAVSIRQRHAHEYGLFCMDSPFAYLSVGPSVIEERQLKAGEPVRESYEVIVADIQGF